MGNGRSCDPFSEEPRRPRPLHLDRADPNNMPHPGTGRMPQQDQPGTRPRVRRIPGKPPAPTEVDITKDTKTKSKEHRSNPNGTSSDTPILDAKKANAAISKKRTNPRTSAQDDTRFDRVIFLGTSSAIPVPAKRNMSSLLICGTNGSSVMVDCGEGTQHQLKVCSRAKSSAVDLICITHLHGDHCYGLFGLLLTCGQDMRASPVTIVGPEGIFDLVMNVFTLSGGWAGYYDLIFVEIPNALHEQKVDVDLTASLNCFSTDVGSSYAGGYANPQLSFLKLTATPLVHGMTCWGYVFQEQDRPGKLDFAKARKLGVPNGPLLGKLKKGEDVQIPSTSTVVFARDVVSESVPGRKICVLQDSSDSSYAVRSACLDADLFIHEATLESSMRKEAVEKGHSTPEMAAEWAMACNAKKLVLTHFSARYNESTTAMLSSSRRLAQVRGLGEDSCCEVLEEPQEDVVADDLRCTVADPAEQILAKEARLVFTRGEVIAAKDFLMLDGSCDFAPSKELVVKRMPWARALGRDVEAGRTMK